MPVNVPSGRKNADDALVLALATGVSVPVAARRAEVHEKTVYRRLKDPRFKTRVAEMRDRLLSEAVGRLLAVAGKAIATLAANLKHEDARVTNRAALGILTHLMGGINATNLKAEVAEMRGLLEAGQAGQKGGDEE